MSQTGEPVDWDWLFELEPQYGEDVDRTCRMARYDWERESKLLTPTQKKELKKAFSKIEISADFIMIGVLEERLIEDHGWKEEIARVVSYDMIMIWKGEVP